MNINMFLIEDEEVFAPPHSKDLIIDEVAHQIALTESVGDAFLYIESIKGDLTFKDDEKKEEIDEFRTEIQDINDELKDDKITLSELKTKWNYIIAKLFRFFGWINVFTGVGAATGAIQLLIGKFIKKGATKSDLKILQKDVERLKKKLEELKNKDKKHSAVYKKNIERLDTLLERIQAAMPD